MCTLCCRRFARARQAENPELASVYEAKLAAMAADGKRNEDAQVSAPLGS